MDFGLLPAEELDAVNFELAVDSAFTTKTLSSAVKQTNPGVYIGCAKWGRKEWVGKIYPARTKEANFLDHYVRHFNSIELNATHYKVHGPSVIANWAAKANQTNFRFCPKVPQSISHFSNLITPQAQETTSKFLQGILSFGEHLGPIFLQLSDKFSPAKKENLFSYLRSLPSDLSFFVEVRHPGWFADTLIREEYLNTLKDYGVGAVITDTAGRRDCVHMELTVPKAFIRFVGNNLHRTDYTRIDAWVQRIKYWLDNGLQEVYFFMHHSDEKDSPASCAYVVEQVNRHCNLQLIKPQFLV
ncbi:MAG: DUF72 domain-containing protein [Chitinophagaceae bacterium]